MQLPSSPPEAEIISGNKSAIANLIYASVNKAGGLAMRRFILAVLSVCLVALAGCQSSPNPSGLNSAGDVIHLTLWHGVNPPPNRDVLQTLVDRFNQTHPTIQVESLYVGQGDQQPPKILAAVVG
ncbi:MAG TPA: hypothetical protein V6C88_17805, partial [Chroococcidiopsis sp.]